MKSKETPATADKSNEIKFDEGTIVSIKVENEISMKSESQEEQIVSKIIHF